MSGTPDDAADETQDVIEELKSQRSENARGYMEASLSEARRTGQRDEARRQRDKQPKEHRRTFLYGVGATIAGGFTALLGYLAVDDNGRRDSGSKPQPVQTDTPVQTPDTTATEEPVSTPRDTPTDEPVSTPEPTSTERQIDFYSKETWLPGLETMAPAQYTDSADDDATIVDICKEYQESRHEDIAVIGKALFKDSNDIILDEQGDNNGENLAISWWHRDDIINETEYDDLPGDIEGIVALNDWQKNVYEFSILDEEQYDTAVETAEEGGRNYSLQNPADPIEYLEEGGF